MPLLRRRTRLQRQKTGDNVNSIFQQLQALSERIVDYLPILVAVVIVLVLTLYLSRKIIALAKRLLVTRIESAMLRNLVTKLLAVPILILGFYIALSISGLGSMAMTLVGGTGVAGLVLGIAFRNITENFLASILLSIQRPFVLGDMIKIQDYMGMVEAMTTRGTVLITLDGNHVQIPNTTIYKEPIINYTTNPNIRQYVQVGIGYEESISEVQGIIFTLLKEHAAVIQHIEALVLVEKLGASTVNLGVYFWVDGHKHNVLKVRSSVLRLIKSTLMERGISMPDSDREIIFPYGMPGMQADTEKQESVAERGRHQDLNPEVAPKNESSSLMTPAEGDLASDKNVLEAQAKNGVLGENNINILKN